jgi:hypothetical protein
MCLFPWYNIDIQKYVHLQNEKKSDGERTENYTSSPLWWLGFSFTVICSLTDLAALAFASQAVVVACGGATTLIVNNLFAKYWHGEYLGDLVVYGVGFVVVGAILLAVGAVPPQTHGPPINASCKCVEPYTSSDSCCRPFPYGLYDFASSPYFVAYCAVLIITITVSLGFIASSSLFKV